MEFCGNTWLVLLALRLDLSLTLILGDLHVDGGKHGMEPGRQNHVESPAVLVLQVPEIAVD